MSDSHILSFSRRQSSSFLLQAGPWYQTQEHEDCIPWKTLVITLISCPIHIWKCNSIIPNHVTISESWVLSSLEILQDPFGSKERGPHGRHIELYQSDNSVGQIWPHPCCQVEQWPNNLLKGMCQHLLVQVTQKYSRRNLRVDKVPGLQRNILWLSSQEMMKVQKLINEQSLGQTEGTSFMAILHCDSQV